MTPPPRGAPAPTRQRPRPAGRGLGRAVIAAGGCAVLGIVALGLPGAALYELSRPLIRLVYGRARADAELGDAAWPLAIVISLAWPFGIVLGYLVGYRALGGASRVRRLAAFLAVLGAWAVGVATALFALV